MTFSPQVEVCQEGEKLIVRADMPGVKKEDLKVEVRNDELQISGERKSESERRDDGYFHTERSYGRFMRSIPLPEGAKAESTNAKFNDVPAGKAEPGEHAESSELGHSSWGLALVDPTPEQRQQLQMGQQQGAAIAQVQPRSPADEAGLQSGDVIVNVNGTDVHNAQEAQKALRSAKAPCAYESCARGMGYSSCSARSSDLQHDRSSPSVASGRVSCSKNAQASATSRCAAIIRAWIDTRRGPARAVAAYGGIASTSAQPAGFNLQLPGRPFAASSVRAARP